jgi:hypothetical protein
MSKSRKVSDSIEPLVPYNTGKILEKAYFEMMDHYLLSRGPVRQETKREWVARKLRDFVWSIGFYPRRFIVRLLRINEDHL